MRKSAPTAFISRLTAVTLLAASSLGAAVTLPNILADHMVLQRDRPVHFWGTADPNESVSVTFRGETQSTAADALGRWSLYLAPGAAGGPFPLTVKAANTIAFTDILVGDVWLASGQSNMEFSVRQVDNAESEIAAAKYPKIRIVRTAHKVAAFPLDDVAIQDAWSEVTPETIRNFSAVAYFFGRHIQEKQAGVPIGLIESNWGGTPVEAWTSLNAIGADAALMPIFAHWARLMDAWPNALAQLDQRTKRWEEQAAQAKAEGKEPPRRPTAPQARPEGEWAPAYLYNAMIAPLTPFPIRGAIWYQGENNANNDQAAIYERVFETMITDWRRRWNVGDFPFLFVQLANYRANPSWPELREAQRKTLSLANTGMAVIIDIGNPTNIHPTNKQDVGLRLALAARAIAYGEKIEYSGPAFRQATRDGSAMRAWFDHTGGGMVAKGGALKGFEIAGRNREYVAADARIDGNSVIVSSASVTDPMYVRYAWADNPDCTLYNTEGLPASPFGSEE